MYKVSGVNEYIRSIYQGGSTTKDLAAVVLSGYPS